VRRDMGGWGKGDRLGLLIEMGGEEPYADSGDVSSQLNRNL